MMRAMAASSSSQPSASSLPPADRLPRWVILWLALAAVVVTWDALFVLNRPASMPGGPLHALWKPYGLYVQVDHRYGNLQDPFVVAQSYMNLIEIALGLLALRLHQTGRRGAVLLAYSVSLMTLAKTVLYFVMDAVSGFAQTRHNSLAMLVPYYLMTNGVWLILPALVVSKLGRRLTATAA